MLKHRGSSEVFSDRWRVIDLLRRHEQTILDGLKAASQVDMLIVDYPRLVANPMAFVPRLREFLGAELVRTPDAMPLVVNPKLYRQRVDGL